MNSYRENKTFKGSVWTAQMRSFSTHYQTTGPVNICDNFWYIIQCETQVIIKTFWRGIYGANSGLLSDDKMFQQYVIRLWRLWK